jgi:hypothetical protein
VPQHSRAKRRGGDLGIQIRSNVENSYLGVINMSTLTQLSDAELDEVNGGFFNTFVFVSKIASNVNLTSQSETNVGIGQFGTRTGGGQFNSTTQIAIA